MVHKYMISVSVAYCGLMMQYPMTSALAATMMSAAASGLKCLFILDLFFIETIIAKITENVNRKFTCSNKFDKIDGKLQENFTEYTLFPDIML